MSIGGYHPICFFLFLLDFKKIVPQLRELKVYIQSIGEVSLPVVAKNFFNVSCHSIALQSTIELVRCCLHGFGNWPGAPLLF